MTESQLLQRVQMFEKRVVASHLAQFRVLQSVVHALPGLSEEERNDLFRELLKADNALQELQGLPPGPPPLE